MRLRELFTTTLNELKMAPGSLKKLSDNIKGFCGIEFELYAPGVNSGGDDSHETENDYSHDPICYSIEDIADFYENGDFNDGSTLQNFVDELTEKYYEYANEKMSEEFNNEAEELVREYIIENDWDEDEKFQEVYEELGYTDEEIDACERWRNGWETDEDKNSWSGPKFSQAKTEVEEMLDEAVAYSIRKSDRNYDGAREQWEESRELPSQEYFLRYEGIRRMSDIEGEYHLIWPYGRFNDNGGVSMTELASVFEDAIGRAAFGCENGYHGCDSEKGKDQYVLESDGSLHNPKQGFSGVEIVAPTLPLSEMVDEIKHVIAWAKDYGCYTDHHCGLHVNISIEGIPMNKVDYVKLALFIGDIYVLSEFNRVFNTYAVSAFLKIQDKLDKSPELAFEVLNKLQQDLSSVAGKLIHSGITEKKVSLNAQEQRLEVRSPGGDWMNEDVSKLESMVHRFIVALDIACDPTKYKEEYAKKFYKLFSSVGQSNDAADAFSKYNAGMINVQQLKNLLLSKKSSPQLPLGKTKPIQQSWTVSLANGPSLIVRAESAVAAINVARKQLKLNSVQYPNNLFTVEPVVQSDMFANLHPDNLSPIPTNNPVPKSPDTQEEPRLSVRDRIAQNSQGNVF